ncbi:MAG: fumarate/nitrate reduction transcriptional regulator Fnr [Pseudomonadota bacterium]
MVRSTPLQSRCSNCALRHVCLPLDLSKEEVEKLDSVIYFRRLVKRGQAIYRAGSAFESIYAVRFGSFKTVILHNDGREQVTGFQMTGELLGLDGISAEKHTCDAIALEDSELCVIPFQHLEALCREREQIQRHVHKIMSTEIVRESGLMLLLGNMRAEERLAIFLLNLSQRFKVRGYSSLEFQLRMTREEIGNYLGMKLETVSRTFSKFQNDGLISTNLKQIRILDIHRLQSLIRR